MRFKHLVVLLTMMTCVLSMTAQERIASLSHSYKSIEIDYSSKELREIVSPLYDGWSNVGVRAHGQLPTTHNIDMSDYCLPVKSRRVTSKFGMRWGRMHNGVDVGLSIGDTVYSAFGGRVRIVNYEKNGYGNYIVIRHPNGLETVYGHLSKQLITVNSYVKSGQPIGLGGNTGRSTGPHLHFETRICGIPIDPLLMFDFAMQTITCEVYKFVNTNSQTFSSKRRKKRKK